MHNAAPEASGNAVVWNTKYRKVAEFILQKLTEVIQK